MTTPGGGDGNEIEFRTRIIPGGDEATVARQVGERTTAAYSEAVREAGAVRLPPLDVGRMYDQIDDHLTRMEQRVQTAARNIGLRLNEGVAGQQRLGGDDLRAQWDQYERQFSQLGGRVMPTFAGTLAEAIKADTRRLEQGYDYLSQVTKNGQRIKWALNEEGRQAIARQGEPYTAGSLDSSFQGSRYPMVPSGRTVGQPYEPGDLDQVRAKGMAAISRITLDDATYAFENGEFFKTNSRGAILRAAGPVDNPELQARLQAATLAKLDAIQGEVVNDHLRDIASRDSRFARVGIRDLGAQYVYGQAQEAEVDAARREVDALEKRLTNLRQQVQRDYPKQVAGQQRKAMISDIARYAYRTDSEITPELAEARQSERIRNGLQGRAFDPARLAREAEVLRAGIADTEVALTGQLRAAQHRLAAASRVPTMSAFDVGSLVIGEMQDAPGLPGIQRAIASLEDLGIQAPEVFDALRTQMVELIDAEERATVARQREALATRETAEAAERYRATLLRLQAAFASHVDPEDARRQRVDQAALSLQRQAQERAFQTYAPNLATGGAGGGGEPPRRPPTGGGLADPDDENSRQSQAFYDRVVQARAEAARYAREEAAAQRLITAAQERAFGTYRQNLAATSYQPNIQATAHREAEAERARRMAESPIAQLGARETGYENAQAIRRALGEVTEGLRTVTLSARNLAPAVDGATVEMTAAQRRLSAVPQVQARAGERLPAGEVGRINAAGEAQFGQGKPIVRTIDDRFAEMSANGKLRAISATTVLARAEQQLQDAQRATTRTTQAQERSVEELTDAERKLLIAHAAYTRAMAGGDVVAQAKAINQLNAAERGVHASERGQGRLGGFLTSFSQGLTMARGPGEMGDNNAFLRLRAESGEFLGAIARYQAAYAIIFGLAQGFSALIRSEIQAQDVMIEFSHATETAGEGASRLANAMGRIGAQAGFSVAQSMQNAVRGIYAFQDQIEREGVDRSRVAAESVRQSANLTLIAPTLDPNQAQTQLIAAANGFELGFQGQARVLDAAYNAMRNYGGAVEETIAALPTLAEVANNAGLSVEQMANLVSISVSRTAMNGTGVASLINRVFGNMNAKPEIAQQLEGVGVDASGTAGQTLYNLAAAWDELTKAQKNQIVASLGGHEVARALLPILSQGATLVERDARSYENLGAAQDLAFEKAKNLAGVVRQLGGDFQNFGRALFDTGVADIFGAMLMAIHPVVEGVNSILGLVTMLPGPTERWLFMLVEVAGVLALIGRHQRTVAAATAANTAAAGAEATARTVGAGAGLVGGARNAGGLVVGGLRGLLTGASGVAIGLVALTAAIGGTVEALRKHKDAEEGAAAAVEGLGYARSSDELRSAANALGNARSVQENANNGIFGRLTAGRDDLAREDSLEVQARWAARMADEIDAEMAQVSARTSPLGAFFTNTGEWARDMAGGIAAMNQAGVPAVRMLENLTNALKSTDEAARPTTDQMQVYANRRTVGAVTTAALGAVTDFDLKRTDIQGATPSTWEQIMLSLGGSTGQAGGAAVSGAIQDAARQALEGFDPNTIQGAIDDVLAERNLNNLSVIDEATQGEIVNAVIASLGMEDVLTGEARERLQTGVRAAILGAFGGARGGVMLGLVSQQDLDRFVFGEAGKDGAADKPGQLDPLLQGIRGRDPRRIGGEQEGIQAQVNFLRELARQTREQGLGGAAGQSVEDRLAAAEHELAQSEVARLQRLRDATLSRTTDPIAAERLTIDSAIAQVQAAVSAGDDVVLLEVMDDSTDAALDAARAVLVTNLHVAAAALRQAQAVAAAAAALPRNDPDSAEAQREAQRGLNAAEAADAEARRRLGSFDNTRELRVGGGAVDADDLAQARILAQAQVGDSVSQAKARRDAAAYARDHADNELDRINAEREYREAEHAYTQAIIARTNAATADDVRPGDALAAATARVQQARETLEGAVEGTQEWSEANQAYDEALYAEAQARNDLANARSANRVRPGNDISAARSAVEQAANDLRTAVRGTAEWERAQQQLDEARYSLAEAELAAVSNRRLLATDITDPLERARIETLEARDRQRRNARNRTGDPDADRLAVREAQANEEATANQQRFSAMQTAEELGRITHGAYMRYLNGEKARLEAIANRTYDQQQFLDQIDRALMAANEQMNSQFNLGDIRVPTVYEARRYAQTALTPQGYMPDESRIGAGAQASGGFGAASHIYDNRTVTIVIQGGDLQAVTSAVSEAAAVTTTVGSRPRKY